MSIFIGLSETVCLPAVGRPKGRVSAERFIQILKQHGFIEHHWKGSHCMLKNTLTGKYTVIPVHNKKELGIGLMLAILKKAGLDRSILN